LIYWGNCHAVFMTATVANNCLEEGFAGTQKAVRQAYRSVKALALASSHFPFFAVLA
jgi:hypothetical protein